MSTQPILAFDCATVGGSVAVMVGGTTLTSAIGPTAQAAELVPAIEAAMREASITYRDLAGIVSTIGPGSFTGVRIGLAALHGLVLVHHTPIKLLTTLEAMAWAVAARPHAPARFYVALRAGKGEVYAQAFTREDTRPMANGEITLMPETYDDWDAPCFGNHVASDDAHFMHGPEAKTLCNIAHHLPITPLAEALPLYIRAPDAIAAAPHPWLIRN